MTAEFRSLITTYGVHSLDFDIENATTVNDTRANHFRNLAVAALEATNPELKVTYTMATTAHGLSHDANSGSGDDLQVLIDAKKDGVRIDVVNIMAMDYYGGTTAAAAPFVKADGSYDMYKAAVSAANHVETQLKHLRLDTITKVGVTPMIGQNDDYAQAGFDGVQEFFSLSDARRLEHWAETKSWVAGLGEWALPRDRAGSPESGLTSPNDLGPEHSGAAQSDWQFAKIFDAITHAPGATNAAHIAAAAFGADSAAVELAVPVHHADLAGQLNALVCLA